LFADNTSILVTSPNLNDFWVNINTAFNWLIQTNKCTKTSYVFVHLLVWISQLYKMHGEYNVKFTAFNCLNEWLKVNLLSTYFNKTHYIQFTTNSNNPTTNIKIAYDNKQITTISNIKLLGIYINDTINWKCHIEHINSKLSVVCYIMRSIKYMSLNTLKTAYHSYFNSIINYGLPFWGNSPHSIIIFRMENVNRGSHAEIYLGNWRFYLWHLSTYFLSCLS
jgi:hypothetical protein